MPEEKERPLEPMGALPGLMSGALSALGVSHLDQYFGLWCVQVDPFQRIIESVQGLNLVQHIAVRQDSREREERTRQRSGDGRDYEMAPGAIAIIEVRGVLTKYGSSLDESSSTVAVRRKVRQAANDQDVWGILLRFDSPGGSSAGTQDLAEDVAAAAARKPVYAFCEDLCASAAYWVASQCTKVFCNPSAMVGSIGTYAVVHDMSAMATQLGLKVHVVRAGEFKGAGEPGTEVTQEQLAEWQRIVDETNQFFVRGVAQGRKLPLNRVQELADGRVHIGQAAVAQDLVDGVQGLDDTLFQLQARAKKGRSKMSASYKELKQALPKASAEFLTQCLDQELTVEAARDAWMAHLENQNAELVTQAKKAKAKKDEEDEDDDDEDEEEEKARRSASSRKSRASQRRGKAKTEADDEDEDEEACHPSKGRAHQPGTDGVGTKPDRRRAAYNGDPVNDFALLVAETRRDNPTLSRRDATLAAIRRDPELHKQYVRATNPSDPGTQGLIDSLLSRRPVRQQQN
jgi:signal peptide peptidase SppA